MERGMGFNIHLSYTSDGYWAQLLGRFVQDKPAALLLLDSFGHGKEAARALDAAQRLPDTLIIYRKFLSGDNQHAYLSPAQWVAEHQQFAGTRVYCSADNEPAFAASLPWLLEVAKAARAANIRVSLGGWSVGGYEIADIPKMDALLRYTAANAGRFVYDLHEYTRGSWTVDFMPHEHNPANWPLSIPRSTPLWLMGRFRHIITYCDTMGIKRPQIVIGEFGFDRVHAIPSTLYGGVGGLNTLAGLFQSWGYENWQAYAAVQLQAAFHAIYRPYGVPVCYYQLCDHPDNWREFNAYHAPTFMDATRKGFEMTILPQPPAPTYKPYALGQYTLDGNSVRIRYQADTNAATMVILGQNAEITVLSTDVIVNDGYGWQKVRYSYGMGGDGYMALHGPEEIVNWKLIPVATPPDDRGARLIALAEELEGIAAKIRAEAANV
jgi:hypothetical protein